MDNLDRKTRSRIMSSIRSKNTSPEVKVFTALRKKGIYFQRHYKRVNGTPDIALPSCKKAIFIDGDFWHGFRYPTWKKRLSSKFWINKIERNRERDKLCHKKLRKMGWKVLRIWEHQVNNHFEKTIDKIIQFLTT